MKRKLIATIVGSALIGMPVAYAQQTYDSHDRQMRSMSDGRIGGTNEPSATSGAVPSTSPQQGIHESRPSLRSSRDSSGAYRSIAADTSQRPSGVRGWWQSFQDRVDDGPSKNFMQYSLTDGDIGGTNVPSATSGAVPSTSPNIDMAELREDGRLGGDNRLYFRAPHVTKR
jgi:hypothetical protein